MASGPGHLTDSSGVLVYERHRSRALALAADGECNRALDELNDGWTDNWPDPTAYAVDVARIRYLVGDYEGAMLALELAARGAERADATIVELATACVRSLPRLRWRALRLALDSGTLSERARRGLRVVRAS